MTNMLDDAPTMDLSKLDKPSLTFTFTDTERAPLKMTYGLEMDIRRVLPDPGTAMKLVMYDNFTQDYIIRRCLTPARNLITELEDLIPVDEVDITHDESDGLLKWALEHALYFFATRTDGVTQLGVRFQEIFPKTPDQPSPSSTGSEDSPLPMPSAGPSTSKPKKR